MVCLETDFLIALIRKDAAAIKKLESLVIKGERITTTPINASELFRGAYLSSKIEDNLRKVRGILSRIHLLDFNFNAAEIFGQVSSELQRKGEDIGVMDTLIASISLANNERILTRNTKHFSKVKGLEVESW